MKRIISIALLLAMTFSMVVSAKEVKVVGFSDLEAEWSKYAIKKCLDRGAVDGTTPPDENGIAKFSPKMNVSLGQFLAALTKLLCPELVKPQEAGQSWTLPYYNAAIEANIIGKNDFDYANIDKNLSREDMAYIVVGAAKYNGEDLAIKEKIEDYIADYNSVSENRKDAVKRVYSAGLIMGVDDNGTFSPRTTMTREQMAVLICRIMNWLTRPISGPDSCPGNRFEGHAIYFDEIKPTRTEQGYTLYYCLNCDYSYKDDYKDVLPPYSNDGGIAVTESEKAGRVAGKMADGPTATKYRPKPNPNASKETAMAELNNLAFYAYGGLRFFDDGIAENYADKGAFAKFVTGEDGRTGIHVFGWSKRINTTSATDACLNVVLEAFYYLTGDRYVAKGVWDICEYMHQNNSGISVEELGKIGFEVKIENEYDAIISMNGIDVYWEWGNGINGNNFFFYPAK